MRSVDGLALRQIGSRKLRAALTAMAVALGVGMVFGVLLLSTSVRQTFDDLLDSAWGTTDLVVAGVGGSGVVSDATVEAVRTTPGVETVGTAVGGVLQRLGEDGKPVDAIKGQMYVAAYDPSKTPPYDMRQVEGRPVRTGDETSVERNWAKDHGIEVGERIRVGGPDGRAELTVVGIFAFSSNLSFGGQGLAVVPLDRGRSLLGVPEGVHLVNVHASDRGQVDALRARLTGRLGSGFDVKSPSQYSDDIGEQMQALDVVLLMFGGMALFVGGFLILNSFNTTVLQRSRELGTLRTLGATRFTVARTVLAEALGLAVVGTAAGLALGLLLARGLMALMQDMGMPVGHVYVGFGPAAIATATGIVVTLVGAAVPARRAGRVSPIRAVLGDTQESARPTRRRAVLALALFLPGALYGGEFWFGNQSGVSAVAGALGIAGTMAMFAGMVVGAPFFITPLVAVLARPMRRLMPATGRLASDAARGNRMRTAATAAALTVGLSVVVVNSTMATSFVESIDDQMTATMVRDLTVRPVGSTLESGGALTVPRALSRAIAGMPEVAVVSPVRVTMTDLPELTGSAQTGLVLGVDPATFGEIDRSRYDGVTQDEVLAGLRAGGVVVNGGYAETAQLQRGDRLRLRGPRGVRSLPIVGVLDQLDETQFESVTLSARTMRELYGPIEPAELAVKAASDDVLPVLQRRVNALIERDHPAMEALSSAEVRETMRDHIDQQFAFFNAIVAIAIIVSLLGIVNTLSMSVLERTREIGVLRALGSSRWTVRRMVMAESILVTVAGGAGGLVLGGGVAWWWGRGLTDLMPGLQLHIPFATGLAVAAGAVVLGAIAAGLPARRAARLQVVRALTAE